MQPPETHESAGLDSDELQRYSRQLILPEFGEEGQNKLKSSRVLLVGAGGLGSPTALYLAAAGVGQIGLVDFDVVDITNLHRQIIHGTNDIGRPKLESATEKIRAINPHVDVRCHSAKLSSENALDIVADYDIVVDGTDNFPTRYLVNDACVLLGKTNVYGSVFRFEGQATVFAHKGGPCYRCLYPTPPPVGLVPSCAEGGVLGVLPGLIGLIQATETIKLLTGVGDPLVGRLVLYDALGMSFRELKIRRDPKCPICGDMPTITGLIDYLEFCGLNPTARESTSFQQTSPAELRAKMASQSEYVLVDVREQAEFDRGRIPGSILISLGQLPARLDEIDRSKEVIVHCQSGGRSTTACGILVEAGFQNVSNLTGGYSAWSTESD